MKKIQHIFSIMIMAAAMVSCSQDLDVEGNQGYVALRIQSFVSTNTPDAGTRSAVPEDYDAKQLSVEIKNQSGNVVMSTEDFDNDAAFQGKIALTAGTYTIEAHSANWDGSDSGFDSPYYYGSTTVNVQPRSLQTASITCTQANVKLTVTYDQSFVKNFKSASTTITSSLSDVAPLSFVMNETSKSGYIPAGNFEAKLDVVNHSNVEHSLTRAFTDVQPRDHYILNFKLADEGILGGGDKPGITVDVDESTNTYTYTFEVPRKSAIALVARQANAWSSFAMLNAAVTAKTATFDRNNLAIQWRQSGTEAWNELTANELTVDADDNVTTTIKGLTPNTTYEYRLYYADGETDVASDPSTFTTEEQVALYNGGFENWWMDGKVAYATEEGVSFWDTSNKGAASFAGSNTIETTSIVHGGAKAAELESKYIVIKFAAASLYTGQFIKLNGTKGAALDWGVPFTSRPTALRGFMQYAPANIDRVGSNLPADAPAKGEADQCGMYCALLTEVLHVDNTDMSTFPDWQNDPRVIAYGALPTEQNVHSNGEWKEVNIPLVYHDLTKKPAYLLVVFSSSKYGDYFHGGTGSKLYLDDFSLEYGDTPAVK